MRKNITFLAALLLILNCACWANLSDTVKTDFAQGAYRIYSPKKAETLVPIEKQIAEKEALIKKINNDEKLSSSQKTSKTSLLQKEINTLKIQKNNIEKAGG